MLQTTGKNESQSTLVNTHKKDQDIPSDTTRVEGGRIGRSIKNLLTITNLAKSKKLKSTKSKKSDLPKASFVRVNSATDFLTHKAKKAFIHLQNAFTKALILKHFDPKYYICIEINALGYAITGVLS